MAVFDAHIARLAAYVAEMHGSGWRTREFSLPCGVTELTQGLPIRIGPGANRGIILRADTFMELGNPTAGSCACVLWTNDISLVRDGRVTLIGPDISEARGRSLPFGQVLLVGGDDLGAEEHESLGQSQYVADQIEGYMVRSSSRNIWSRVSNDVAARGFCFAFLGRSLMALYKSSAPKVRVMEIVFVTSSREDVLRLEDIAAPARELGAGIVKEQWKAKGYDLECDLDCRSCHDRNVCDDVRKIIAARLRKERAITRPAQETDHA